MKKLFNFPKSKVAKAIPDMITEENNQPTDEEIEQAQQETGFLADIMMRVLANRSIVICFNTCATVLQSIAHSLPKAGRDDFANWLEQLTDTIRSMKDEKVQ